jgi:hypothetical protein
MTPDNSSKEKRVTKPKRSKCFRCGHVKGATNAVTSHKLWVCECNCHRGKHDQQ